MHCQINVYIYNVSERTTIGFFFKPLNIKYKKENSRNYLLYHIY